jgi:hypothetical protein
MLAGDNGHTAAHFVKNPSSESLGTILSQIMPDPDVEFVGGTHPFNYMHKVIGGHDVYYFGNIDTSISECTIRLGSHSFKNTMSILDPHTGKSYPAELIKDGQNVKIRLSLNPSQSLFLVDDALLRGNKVKK